MSRYVSALAWKQAELELPPISDELRSLIAKMTKGAGNKDEPRGLLHHMTSSTIVRMAKALKIQCRSNAVLQQQELAATVFGFLFCLRADTISNVNMEHLEASTSRLTFHEWVRKSKNLPRERKASIPVIKCLPSQSLVAYMDWLHKTDQFHPGMPLFGDKNSQSSGQWMSDMVETACKCIGAPSKSMTSHGLRRGAAIAMNSLRINIMTLMGWGVWANPASVSTYLRGYTVLDASDDDQLCFGWLK